MLLLVDQVMAPSSSSLPPSASAGRGLASTLALGLVLTTLVAAALMGQLAVAKKKARALEEAADGARKMMRVAAAEKDALIIERDKSIDVATRATEELASMRDELRATVDKHAERTARAERIANQAAGLHAAAVRDHGRLHSKMSSSLRRTRRAHGQLAKKHTKLLKGQFDAAKQIVKTEFDQAFHGARIRGAVAPHHPNAPKEMLKGRRPVVPGEHMKDVTQASRRERARTWHAKGPGGVEVDRHPDAKPGYKTYQGCGPKHFALGKC